MTLSYNQNYFNHIYYNSEEEAYELERQIGSQTIWMQFGYYQHESMSDLNDGWVNVALSIYNKSKDIFTNMDKKLSTGIDPIRNFIVARKMFDALEAIVVKVAVMRHQDVVIFCHWEDNRRRDAYYKVLSKKGYKYGIAPWKQKVIMKKFKWKDYQEMVANDE